MRILTKGLLLIILWFMVLVPALDAEPPTGIDLGHDYTFQLVTGDLTSTGVQYSTVVNTTTAGVDATLLSKDIDLGFGTRASTSGGREADKKYIIDLYFEIYTEIRSVSTATADVEWKPQARNKDGTWTDLVAAYVDLADVNTTYTASTLKGYATTSSTLDEIPLDFRILMKCDELNEGRGRVKSSSYVRITFKDITWGI